MDNISFNSIITRSNTTKDGFIEEPGMKPIPYTGTNLCYKNWLGNTLNITKVASKDGRVLIGINTSDEEQKEFCLDVDGAVEIANKILSLVEQVK